METDDDAQLHADLTDDGQRQNGVSIMNTLARKLKDGGRATELKIFNEEELSAALSVYVDKEENGAFDTFCTKAMKETQHRLLTTTGARGDGGGGGGKPHESCLESSLERSAHHSDPSDARAMIPSNAACAKQVGLAGWTMRSWTVSVTSGGSGRSSRRASSVATSSHSGSHAG